MKLSKAAAGVSFLGALAIGMAAAYVAAFGWTEAEEVAVYSKPPEVEVTYRLSDPGVYRDAVTVTAKDLAGAWKGSWGYLHERCLIEIDRVDGDWVYGTLRKEGAVISLVGEFDPEGQRLLLRETKVVRLGANMSEWSLGTNTGTFSVDGRTVSGTGIDKWGTYEWSVTRE